MKFCKVMFALVTATAAGVGLADTNYWQGPDGGSWGTDANWSLGRVPTAADTVNFTNDTAITVQVTGDYVCYQWYVFTSNLKAPITLTGGGSITASSKNDHYCKKPLFLDNVALALNGRETLFYANVTLRNGAKLTSDGQPIYLWANQSTLSVEDGEVSGVQLRYASGPSSVTLKKGRISCVSLVEGAKNHDGRCNVTIESGELTCSGNLVLTNGTKLAVSGGALTVGGTIAIADSAVLSLTGGAITNAAAITLAQKRLITESTGTSLATTATGAAVDVIAYDGETLAFNAPFSALNGLFVLTNRATVVSAHPFAIKQFYYNSSSTAATEPLTIRLPQLVAGEGQLFDTGNGNARRFHFDGPVTLRPAAAEMSKKTSRTVYVLVDGEVTVDTRDWNDASLKRAMAFRNIGSRYGNGSLVVRGGGSLYLTQTYSEPFRKVTVEEGTTLEIGPFENTEYSPLNTEKLVLGPNSVLKISAASNTVHAGSWEIDPTARIEVTVNSGLADGGTSVLRDWCGALGDVSSQVTLTGDGASACSLVCTGGVLAVVKPVSEVDGTYPQEWTGAAGSGKWATAGNWYNNSANFSGDPGKVTLCAFGCKDDILETDFNVAGAYLRNLVFRKTAISSFSVASSGERTFFSSVATCTTNASVYSASAVPQYVGMKFRRTGGGNYFSFAAADGPIVIASTYCYPNDRGILYFVGDIRVSGNIFWPQISFTGYNSAQMPYSRLTVLDGGVVTVTNQTVAFGSANAAINVRRGGLLNFQAPSDKAVYKWEQPAKKHIVDGEMRIGATFCGGFSQTYGGSGKLTLGAVKPMSAASSVMLADTLTAEVSADWYTTAAGADYPLTLKTASFAEPTIRLTGNWTYGPAAGAAPTSTAASRSLSVDREAVLTVDAAGFVATFADPVTGDGTLAVTNGTVRLDGGADGLGALRLNAGGVLETDGDLALQALTSDGGAIRFTDTSTPIVVAGAADVSGLSLSFADCKPTHWTTLLSASSIAGTAQASPDYETRVRESGNRQVLQCRYATGLILLVR